VYSAGGEDRTEHLPSSSKLSAEGMGTGAMVGGGVGTTGERFRNCCAWDLRCGLCVAARSLVDGGRLSHHFVLWTNPCNRPHVRVAKYLGLSSSTSEHLSSLLSLSL
jgi:hypothetical protein